MKQPENQSKKYASLFADIDCGRIKIPQFQRDFVWDKAQTAKLIDSIIKGFPIGTFIFWKTRERLRALRNVGNVTLPEPPKGDAVLYVLDGQQRITSLYAVRKGIIITRDGEEMDYKDLCVDLSLDPDGEDEVVLPEPIEGKRTISVHKLLTGTLLSFLKSYDELELGRIEIYQKRLTGYDFSVIEIADYEIDIACEIFTRINTGGKALTLFEIMVAKTYDLERNFDLQERYDDLIDSGGAAKDLEDANFETIPPITVLQCVAAKVSGSVKRGDILRMDRDQVVVAWPTVVEAIFAAVDFMRAHLGVQVSRLLPYNTLLIPLAHFFMLQSRAPTPAQVSLLKQYFLWASLSNRFNSAVETKIETDLKRIEFIVQGKAPSYESEPLRLTPEDFRHRPFIATDAFCKAVLCVLVAQRPLSLIDNGVVQIDNSWLKVASSRNFHHFYPKAFLKKRGVDWRDANRLVNIVLVSADLNKRVIKARAPSDYVADFQKKNPAIATALESHLIGDPVSFGITTDDYDIFLTERANKIHELVQSLLLVPPAT
ncbi:MAG: DUF262 domain-containing protein [Lacunisphaera sp.]|jgi:hypothetical protein|nr:DUF262 domain-containing protein [Lacunisphaera sp.]